MKTIYKYPLRIADHQSVLMPAGSEILTVQVQHDTPCLWAMVDPEAKPERRRCFRIYGTGHEITEEGQYIGTFQIHGGSLVFHVFEVADA